MMINYFLLKYLTQVKNSSIYNYNTVVTSEQFEIKQHKESKEVKQRRVKHVLLLGGTVFIADCYHPFNALMSITLIFYLFLIPPVCYF